MAFTAQTSRDFDKGWKRFKSSGRSQDKFDEVLKDLRNGIDPTVGTPRPTVAGKYKGSRHCNVDGQTWVLVYEVDHTNQIVTLLCLGTHNDCDCGSNS